MKGNKNVKISSKLLAIREMQIKAMIMYLYISIKMAKIKVVITRSSGKDVEKLDHSHLVGGKKK